MSQAKESSLSFDDEKIICTQVCLTPLQVRDGDFVFCDFEGLIHVHKVEQRGALVELYDCEDQAHIYNVKTVLDVARPKV